MAKHSELTGTQLHHNRFVGARAYTAAAQTITASTATALTLASEEFDTNAIHDTGSNTSRMTVPAGMGGKWYFRANVNFKAGGSAGTRALWFRKNGADVRGSAVSFNTNLEIKWIASIIIDCAAGDYVEAFVYQASGGNLNVGDNSDPTNAHTVEAHYLG